MREKGRAMAYQRKTIDEHTCPVCNVIFSVPDAGSYVYKALVNKRQKMFCSWGCLQKYRRTGKLYEAVEETTK